MRSYPVINRFGSNMSKSYSNILKDPWVISICRNETGVDTGNFFEDATQRLCGTLDLEAALGSLFQFLQREMPVRTITVGRLQFDLHIAEALAYCDADGCMLSRRRVPFGPELVSMADETFRRRGDAGEGIFALSVDEPYGRFLCALDPKISPPLFFLRTRFGEDFMAGVIFTFEPDRLPSDAQLRQLRSLRAPLLATLSNCFQYRELTDLKEQIVRENLQLRSQIGRKPDMEIIGAGSSLTGIIQQARLAGATDVPVLITGETGAGKEVIAHAVHGFSRRAGAPFVTVNCGAVPASLIDSELFGHVRGAFTGAVQEHKGYFERAHGGTIFLDEIGELPPEVQARLLRVLQDGKIERLGGNTPVPVDFRLIAATHRDLRRMAAEGAFREDLFYRLRVVQLAVPPLRERATDIPLLAVHFLQAAARRFGIVPPAIAPGEMERLTRYAWPGNVRELRNVVEEALVLNPQGPLHFRLHTEEGAKPAPDAAMAGPEMGRSREATGRELPSLEVLHARYFRELLENCGGRINGPGGAAEVAGIKPNTLRFRLDKLGIPYGKKTTAG